MTDRDKIIQVIAEGAAAYEGVTYSMFPKPFNEQAIRILDALETAGLAVVPVVPTEAMATAGGGSIIRPNVYMGGVPPGAKVRARDVWADMLRAAKETGDE
jgi:hypothetical protein